MRKLAKTSVVRKSRGLALKLLAVCVDNGIMPGWSFLNVLPSTAARLSPAMETLRLCAPALQRVCPSRSNAPMKKRCVCLLQLMSVNREPVKGCLYSSDCRELVFSETRIQPVATLCVRTGDKRYFVSAPVQKNRHLATRLDRYSEVGAAERNCPKRVERVCYQRSRALQSG
jgi:hypothetical protein